MNRTPLFAVLALVAFASNSVLCRGALGASRIDAATYTSIRLLAGAALLAALSPLRARAVSASPRPTRASAHWLAAAFLFAYAITFSFAYMELSTGTGALLLFGTVQLTLIGGGIIRGERPRSAEWIGLASALGGFVWLLLPGIDAPSLEGTILMIAAGVAWGCYTFCGRGTDDPVGDTARNFARAVPFAAAASLVAIAAFHADAIGVAYAALSGALASGLGYVAWYAAIPGLSAAQAAIIQLSVPAVTAAGGIALLGEVLTARLVIASAFILGGVAMAAVGPQIARRRRVKRNA